MELKGALPEYIKLLAGICLKLILLPVLNPGFDTRLTFGEFEGGLLSTYFFHIQKEHIH